MSTSRTGNIIGKLRIAIKVEDEPLFIEIAEIKVKHIDTPTLPMNKLNKNKPISFTGLPKNKTIVP
jgi:hypothetical protein